MLGEVAKEAEEGRLKIEDLKIGKKISFRGSGGVRFCFVMEFLGAR
jgi:hypothetical protein